MPDESLRYLSREDVLAALPDLSARLRLAERTMVGLHRGAQLPPKIGVQPLPAGSFAHAMPALLPGSAADGADDLLGVKWVVGFPENVAAGLPAVHGTTILSDGRNGLPRAIVDAGTLTAQRTAAVSGLAIERWGPGPSSACRVAIVGCGAQARSHLPVVAHLLPMAKIVLSDAEPGRAEALAAELADPGMGLGTFPEVRVAADVRAALDDADVILTMVSFGPRRQGVPAEAFEAASLIIAVDYDMCVPATVARQAVRFLVDDREQYLATRASTTFAGYPDDPLTMGEAIASGLPRPAGRVLVTHLGVGLADVVFADAVLRLAQERGIGTLLPR
jgi:ornithine cyclodeaminase/alanine dehydrogenase-like protein (mu-crystallin family)